MVKNQHYIPESSLWHFANADGKLFEALLLSKKIYPTNPGNSMCERFAYEDDNLKINTVENYFGIIEDKFAPLLKNLLVNINKCKTNKSLFISIKTTVESLLPIFVVFYYRSGALLTEFSSFDSKEKILLLSKKILNQHYIDDLAYTIKTSYKFAIIESDSDFLLSDQFVSTAALKIKSNIDNISNRNIGIKETLILIPLSASYYAVYWHSEGDFFIRENSFQKLDLDGIKKINSVIINNAYVKCVGAKQETLDSVLINYHFSSPSQIFVGYRAGNSSGAIRKKEVFFDDKQREAFDMILSPRNPIHKYMEAGRNDPCPCESGKKFKKCHEDLFLLIKIPIQGFINRPSSDIYRIPNAKVVELPIDSWG